MTKKPAKKPAKKPTPKKGIAAPLQSEFSPSSDPTGLVSLDSIEVNPYANPRKTITGIDELAQSIVSEGQLQPLVVTAQQTPGKPPYLLVAGYRRYAALKSIGRKALVTVIQTKSTEKTALTENLARVDMSLYDTAHAYLRLKNQGYTAEKICVAVAAAGGDEKSIGAVNNLARFARDLADPIQKAWRENDPLARFENLSKLASYKDHAEQIAVWDALQSSDESSIRDDSDGTKPPRKPRTSSKTPKIAVAVGFADYLNNHESLSSARKEAAVMAILWMLGERSDICGIKPPSILTEA